VQGIEQSATPDWEKVYYQRLLRLGEHLLSKMEQFYTRFITKPYQRRTYQQQMNPPLLTKCLLLDSRPYTALHLTEDYFGLQAQGSLIELSSLEEAGWTYIYREDLQDGKALSPLDQGLADWIAEEASLRMLHMRLVESFVAVTGTYVLEKPTVERFAETTLLMFDMLARIKGDKLPHHRLAAISADNR